MNFMQNETLGGFLKDERKKRRWSYRIAGKNIGIEFSMISKIEKGGKPTDPVIIALSKGYGISEVKLKELADKIPRQKNQRIYLTASDSTEITDLIRMCAETTITLTLCEFQHLVALTNNGIVVTKETIKPLVEQYRLLRNQF